MMICVRCAGRKLKMMAFQKNENMPINLKGFQPQIVTIYNTFINFHLFILFIVF